MTQDIGSGPHKRPSQQVEVTLAILQERMREAGRRDEVLLKSQAEVVSAISDIKLLLVKGEARMNAIATLQDDTTERLKLLEADKRGPVAIIMAIASGIGAGAVAWFK